jgi:D-alanyl-D-alanine dipeptidase
MSFDYREKPIPWRTNPPTSIDYHNVPLDPNDPRRNEELIDLADLGIASSGYYSRSDGLNAPYYQGFAVAQEQVLCRRSVAELLTNVNERLSPLGIELLVLNGYRSLEMQRVLWEFFLAQGRERVASPSESDCIAFAGTYCSDPRNFDKSDSHTWPAHITGGAVDLTLRIRRTGESLFMGGIFDDPAELSHTAYYEKLGDELAARGRQLPLSHREALRNRRLLYWSMKEAGFVNYPYEWWHFDWGTQAWVRNWDTPSDQAEQPLCAWYGPADIDRNPQ